MDSKTETVERKPAPTVCQVCKEDDFVSHSICAEMASVIARRVARRTARLEQERRQ